MKTAKAYKVTQTMLNNLETLYNKGGISQVSLKRNKRTGKLHIVPYSLPLS